MDGDGLFGIWKIMWKTRIFEAAVAAGDSYRTVLSTQDQTWRFH